MAGSISLGTGTSGEDTVSFNGVQDTITLGSDNCSTQCNMVGSFGDALSTIWEFSQPNDSTSPFTYLYNGTSGTISVTGTPTLTFLMEDSNDDTAQGSYTLTTLESNGNNGVYVNGTITFTSFNPGSGDTFTEFEGEFGFPASTASFTLDIGACTSGNRTGVTCVPDNEIDPTGTFQSGTINPNSIVPEPGTFGLLAAGLGVLALMLGRSSR